MERAADLAESASALRDELTELEVVPEAVPPTGAIHAAAVQSFESSPPQPAEPQPVEQVEEPVPESPRDGIAWKVKLSAARGLLLADVDALGNCFAVVSWGGSSVRSTSRPNTVDPVWHEVLQIPLPLDREADTEFEECLATNPYCTVEVFDERGHGGKPEVIGRLMLSLVQLAQHSGAPACWRRLSAPPRLVHQRLPEPGTLYGEIEFSITLADPQCTASLLHLHGIDGVLRQKAEMVLASAANLALPVSNHDGKSTNIAYPRAVEAIEVVLTDVRLRLSGYSCLGCVALTSHRLVFEDATNATQGGPNLSMEVPVAAVTVAKTWESNLSGFTLISVLLRCSDFRSITLSATTLQSSKCLRSIVDRLELLQTELGDAPCSLAPSTEELWTMTTAAAATAAVGPVTSENIQDHAIARTVVPPASGFRLDMAAEYKQQGVPLEIFRTLSNTQALPLCETYPETIMVPVASSADCVVACADIWAGRRLPVLTYWKQQEGVECAGLFRSATPKVQRGTRSAASDPRQELLESIRDVSKHAAAAAAAAAAATATVATTASDCGSPERSAPHPVQVQLSPRTVQQRAEAAAMYPEAVVESGGIGRLLIADCRSSVAAVGHALAGAVNTATPILGTEYVLVDLANHHAMRASIDAVRQLVHDERDSIAPGGTTSRECVSPAARSAGMLKAGSSIADSYATWLQDLAQTQWLAHVAILLDGAVNVAWKWLTRGGSLLVQCATGRDRSAQLCALIQLLIEPRYRSKAGFATLVRKEFGAFGFAFSQRLGTASAPSERSPIFLQFLDAVHQLRRQCPEMFEFSDAFLVDLAVFSGSEWWSDFLFDDERTRVQQQIDVRCPSVWDWMLAPCATSARGQSYTHPGYNAAAAATASSGARCATQGILPVRVGARHLAFWSSLFLRYDADSLRAAEMASPSTLSNAVFSAATHSVALAGDSGFGTAETGRALSKIPGGGKAVKWHPHAPGRALLEGGVELRALPPELVNDTVLYKFELRVGLTTAGVLQTRYSTARAAHQSLSKQGVLDSFEGAVSYRGA